MTKGFVCRGKTFYFHNLHEKSLNFLVTLTQLSLNTVFILFYLKKPFNLNLRMNIPLLYSENYFNISFLVRGGRNVENQNVKGSERQKYFLDDQNVESQKIRT
jgi:hypothetical protein